MLQCVWSMFAEDLQMLPSHVFTRVLQTLREDPSRSSADDLGQLFDYLATPGARPEHGVYVETPYANGSLFVRPARVHLEPEEVELLARAASEFNWRRVEPAIFGGLLQGSLGRERQWALGAHYTAEADILKIVLPTVVEPWRERIAACRTVADVEAAQNDLMNYVVLDPACGSGNFLYPNMKGIELDPFAVQLARVTMWMGHKLAVDELGIDETVLPLADMSGIRRGDALRLEWPRADAIIGNPPYHGTKLMRGELGDEYVEWLRSEFGVGVKDYAVYWFRKAHDCLGIGQRAGLVATNSIAEAKNREASLDYIGANGGIITNAVSNQDWPGEANVHVSIVNWAKLQRPPHGFVLDGTEVSGITTTLRPGTTVDVGRRLQKNNGLQFYGVVPTGNGFILNQDGGRKASSLDIQRLRAGRKAVSRRRRHHQQSADSSEPLDHQLRREVARRGYVLA